MKTKLLLLLITFSSSEIFPQSQGPNNPAAATYSALGCLACPGAEWSDFTNIFAADGLTADVGLNTFPNCFQTACYYSRFLIATNFAFSVPAAAAIQGVEVQMIRMSATTPIDSIAQIITGGNAGNNHADSTVWTPSPVTVTYGDSTDTWGLPLIADSVNSIHFGFQIMIRNTSTSASFTTSSIDHIQMTVYYSLPTGTFSQTRTSGNFTIYPNPANKELRIQNAELKIKEIVIYNITGEKIFIQQHTTDKQLTIDIRQFTSGIYCAVIDTGTEKTRTKFVINR
jgi:hypothetical protein